MEKLYKSFETKELQFTDDGEFGYFKGYAITWGNIDRAREVAVKGCFAESLKENPRVKMQWQHDYADLIGSYTKLEEDDTGLYCEGRINLATARGKEAYALLKAGDIDGLSIGYEVIEDRYDSVDNIRYLEKLNLYEISLVSVPCNPQAQVIDVKSQTVSIDDIKGCNHNVRDIEQTIKGKPLSANAAKYLAGLVFRSEVEKVKQKNHLRAQMEELKAKMDKLKLGIKENPYHDEQGRFTSAEDDTGGGNGGNDNDSRDMSSTIKDNGYTKSDLRAVLDEVVYTESNFSKFPGDQRTLRKEMSKVKTVVYEKEFGFTHPDWKDEGVFVSKGKEKEKFDVLNTVGGKKHENLSFDSALTKAAVEFTKEIDETIREHIREYERNRSKR